MAHQGRGPFDETSNLELNDHYKEMFRWVEEDKREPGLLSCSAHSGGLIVDGFRLGLASSLYDAAHMRQAFAGGFLGSAIKLLSSNLGCGILLGVALKYLDRNGTLAF
eukprot:scaffold107863_cov19-Tisochrysis_lutea.AAC.2